MASVSAEDVRDVIHVTVTDIGDSQVLKFIKRAEVTLEGQLGTSIDYSSCTDAEKEFTTVLAAIYAICYLTGGSAVERAPTHIGPRGGQKVLGFRPGEKVVLFAKFAMAMTICMSAIEIVHIAFTGVWGTEIFTGLSGLIGTVTGLLIGKEG